MLYILVTKICDLGTKTQRIHCHPRSITATSRELFWRIPRLFFLGPSNHNTIPFFCSYLPRIKSSSFGFYQVV
uniref:Uncharacterized protein n=1 Tax=Arundo donax TaxID=35708 RepID=A0A0A8XVW4_ARUDO